MSIAAWLVNTVTVASVASVDKYGKPTYATARTVKARVQKSRKLLRRPGGEEALSQATIYTLEEVFLTDRVWLPGANTALLEQALSPISLNSSPDKAGARTLFRVDI